MRQLCFSKIDWTIDLGQRVYNIIERIMLDIQKLCWFVETQYTRDGFRYENDFYVLEMCACFVSIRSYEN